MNRQGSPKSPGKPLNLGGLGGKKEKMCIFSKNRGGDPKGFPRWPNYLVEQRILPAKYPI
jgi:hypothetical protein